jgi:lysophospholipase L1-like esterase
MVVKTRDSSSPDNRAPRSTWSQKFRFIALSVIVAAGMLVCIDVLIRVSGLDQASLAIPMLDGEFHVVHRHDDELFFSLRPGIRLRWQGALITTNSLGLRSREISPKGSNEFRILSLGESTTFGAAVEDEETYSTRLEKLLSDADDSHTYRVINAGVSAYSSFQSRKYLETRGLSLEPDLVLIYHELNDFLPTTNRESLVRDRLGLPLSDEQLYNSKRHTMVRRLLHFSAIFRLVSHHLVRREVSPVSGEDAALRPEHLMIPTVLRMISTPEGFRKMNLPPRVTLEERRENLERMSALCNENGIRFAVIHPSYRDSGRHTCDLTEFCDRNHVRMFEAYDSLHPRKPVEGGLYRDLFHPNAEGHKRLAENLFRFLVEWELVPTPS